MHHILRGKNLTINALAGPEGRVIELPADVLIRTATLRSFDAAEAPGKLWTERSWA